MNTNPGDNIPMTGKVPSPVTATGHIISNGPQLRRNAPIIPPEPPAATPTLYAFRGTRSMILAGIAATPILDDETKALLVKRIAAIPAAIELLSVHFHESPYKSGFNGKWTISEL